VPWRTRWSPRRHGAYPHFNKGLAGASADVLAEAKDTSMNSVVLDAFALAIAGNSQPAFLHSAMNPI
jgi:hypothetical protein